jgi:hypothetical protein
LRSSGAESSPPAILPDDTPVFNAIADRVDLHVVYVSEPMPRRQASYGVGPMSNGAPR